MQSPISDERSAAAPTPCSDRLEARCECGQLMAKLRRNGIELKCKRCRRIVLLPFSRKHELEADHWGLIWAAMAGYNPQEAIPLWERMEKAAAGGERPPEFLSTHPSEGKRIDELKKYMPEALKYYKPIGG